MSAEVRPQSPATKRKPVQCWALCRNKQRCKAIVKSREGEPIPIPYCNTHLKCDDYALRVVEHPFAGKCVVARFDLPPKYRMAFHGIRGKCPTSDKEDRSISFYPPNQKTGSNYYPNTRTLKNDNYNGVLNPKHTSDILQYAANPGKNERQNCRSVSSPFEDTTLSTFVDSFIRLSRVTIRIKTFRYWGRRNGRLGGLEFITVEKIPKNTLLMHWYGPGWWAAREMSPVDVATKKYPAPKRRKLHKANGDLVP
jgi:hypothetical protein